MNGQLVRRPAAKRPAATAMAIRTGLHQSDASSAGRAASGRLSTVGPRQVRAKFGLRIDQRQPLGLMHSFEE